MSRLNLQLADPTPARAENDAEPPQPVEGKNPIKWSTAGLLYCFAKRAGRTLLITLTPPLLEGDWGVVAIETGKLAEAEAILGDHAHKNLGEFPDVTSAMRAAETFTKQWRDGIELQQCACGEIEPAT